jgi:methylenetetrahydrofolate dehydrogenase (NADP+) / methenyltetrahydrofolate cyclohydrolase
MELLDGKLLSGSIKDDIKNEVAYFMSQSYRPPHLSAILVGENPASLTYVNNKIKACEYTGIISSLHHFKDNVSETEILNQIDVLNNQEDVDGILVQLPLPPHINVDSVIEHISASKDVDGFHPVNIGKMVKNLPCPLPATPKGILEIIRFYGIETSGKHCVVVGRSQIVGTPISILMGRKDYPGNCTVSLVHSKTKNLAEIVCQGDIVIAAIGIPYYIKPEMVKEGAVVIDVGINSIADPGKKSGYRLVGDVDFDHVAPKCSYISPVPGGVGLMTIAALLQNTMFTYKHHMGIKA